MLLRTLSIHGFLVLYVHLLRLAARLPRLHVRPRTTGTFCALALIQNRLQILHLVPALLFYHGGNDWIMNLVTLKEIVHHRCTFDIGLLNDLHLTTILADVRCLTAFSVSETVAVFGRLIRLICSILILNHVEFQELVLVAIVSIFLLLLLLMLILFFHLFQY